MLTVAARGYSVHWQEVVLSRSGEIIVEVGLVPMLARLRGRVTSASSGSPLAGATVSLGSLSTRTDDTGQYELVDVTPGTYVLDVSAPDHEAFQMTLVIAPGVAETANVELAPMPASVVVRVVDVTTGRPIQGALLTFESSDRLPSADYKLLVPLKRSRAYGAVRRRVVDLRPTDAWRQDELHFFTFALRPLNGTALAEPPVAVFAMHPDAAAPVSALVVTPTVGSQPEIVDLLSLPVAGHTDGLSTNGTAHADGVAAPAAASHSRRPGASRARSRAS